MKQTFLSRRYGSGRLILVFAGWGCSQQLYEDISIEGWDVMLCQDYDDFKFDKDLIADYHTVYLFAWSLGVYAAEHSLHEIKLAHSVAINGTLLPVSDDCGIPKSVYYGTMNSLDERNLKKFRMRMFECVSEYNKYSSLFSEKADIETLKHQLKVVAEGGCERCGINWQRVLIGTLDRIFPAENQRKAWKGQKNVKEIDCPHYIDISKVVSEEILDNKQIAKRFGKSRFTYNDHAFAQHHIARRLGEKIIDTGKSDIGRLLEIGSGTGLLTSKYSEKLKVREAVFVDLCEMPQYGIAKQEYYVETDAEQWLENQPATEKFDYIVSSSTIQWFANIERFFYNCSRHLSKNGVVCVSTFAPGNLQELDSHRLPPIKYYSAEKLRLILTKYFEEIVVNEEKIELQFDSAIDALRNLKLTGVTAAGSSSGFVELKKLMEYFPKNEEGKYVLTYRPIYIVARNINSK